MNYSGKDGRGGSPAPRNDRFSLGRFVRDVAVGAVMGGLASVAFYGAGKGVEALRNSAQRKNRTLLAHDRNGLYSISNAGYKVNAYTKEEILALIDGKTRQSTKIARAIRRGEIKLNILSDGLFEDYCGVDKLVVGIEVKNNIYIRNKADHILSTIVHEGTHALDYISEYGKDGVSHWAWEKRAYFYERQFQLAIGEQVDFTTINEMLIHIWSNYKNEIYNLNSAKNYNEANDFRLTSHKH